MREIVLDTETTGLDPAAGHRIVEVACLELQHHLPTGETFREYLNPDRPVPEEAARIHGLTDDFLKDKPRFHEVADKFLDFVGDAKPFKWPVPDFMKAPEPTWTSRISASRPAASFFDRIEAVMRSIDSTVPVTSRIA